MTEPTPDFCACGHDETDHGDVTGCIHCRNCDYYAPRSTYVSSGLSQADELRDALRVHHPIMRSETGPFSGCRCGGVRLGEDVIAHVVGELSRALDAES